MPKDLYNLQQKIWGDVNKLGNYEEMALIYNLLGCNGYITRYNTDNTKTYINAIFTTNPMCIERARIFPEVVVLDTTNKVDHNGMPLVNIVGIDNLTADHYRERSLRSYYIGSAVAANEETVSYTRILQQLLYMIWTGESQSEAWIISDR